MSFMGMGGGGGGALRFSAVTPGRATGRVTGVNYPSPFFDVAHTWLPTTVKDMFRWCKYYFLTNGLINATVFKLSEYPITDLIIEHDNEEVVRRWTEHLHDVHRIRSFQVECGLDYHCFGNTLVSLSYPFMKYLTCGNCQFTERADNLRPHYIFTNFAFRMTCPKCGTTTDARVKDQHIKNAAGMKLVRWNPENIDIKYNDLTGEHTYFYNLPANVKNDLVIGRKDVIEHIPQIFIQAMKEQKQIVFTKESLFHLKRPSLADQDRSWGIPLLLPVLKDTFYLQLMKKAQESILLEHIVPLRVLFPQAGSGTSDPYTSINLGEWKDHMAAEIMKWRYDNNYIPILPLPVGYQSIGGDGKALLLSAEMQMHQETIMNGMMVPIEFIKGGMSYAGTNVSMRMLENQFLGYNMRQLQMVRWIIRQTAAFLGWPEPRVRFKPFKMADDLQRKAYMLQLNQFQKISDTTLLADNDLSVKEENALMKKEQASRFDATKDQQLAMAELQGEQSLIMAKYQAKAQETMMAAQGAVAAPGEPGAGAPAPAQGPQQQDPGQSPLSMDSQGQQMDLRMGMAMQQAQQLSQMDPVTQKAAIANIQSTDPALAQMIVKILGQMGGQQGNAKDSPMGVDNRPLPEASSPRRATASV